MESQSNVNNQKLVIVQDISVRRMTIAQTSRELQMNRLKLLLVIIIFPIFVYADNSWVLPKRLTMLPVSYLKTIKVQNPEKRLSRAEKKQLIDLFVSAYRVNTRKYQQDYLIETNVPIYMLLKTNFPEVASKEGEGGVFIGNIVKVLTKKR